MKKIAIFGSTGSIGVNALNVIREFPKLFKVTCLSANRNINLLNNQILEFKPKKVIITNENAFKEFKSNFNDKSVKIFCGKKYLEEILYEGNIDLLINSLVGFCGLSPTIAAIQNRIDIALANKESLVTAGEIIMPLLKKQKVKLLPIDSEHSAILQCLIGEDKNQIEKIILTASGGPFLKKEKNEFHEITIDEALKHPNWKMGNKITIDSATLLNKGLEVIEAKWLFDLPPSKIEVIIHPQSIIHSMVEFIDGSIKAQIGVPDMKIPIQYALTYPERLPSKSHKIDFIKLKELQFFRPDQEKFECLKLAYSALEKGGITPTILNASNEVAVHLFLNKKIKFTEIPEIIKDSISFINNPPRLALKDIFKADLETRERLESEFRIK